MQNDKCKSTRFGVCVLSETGQKSKVCAASLYGFRSCNDPNLHRVKPFTEAGASVCNISPKKNAPAVESRQVAYVPS
jgi:hypothetical protein